MVRSIAVGLVLVGASSSWAHPGHGGVDSNTPLHYVFSLEHAVPVAFLGMVAFGVGVALLRTLRSQSRATAKRVGK